MVQTATGCSAACVTSQNTGLRIGCGVESLQPPSVRLLYHNVVYGMSSITSDQLWVISLDNLLCEIILDNGRLCCSSLDAQIYVFCLLLSSHSCRQTHLDLITKGLGSLTNHQSNPSKLLQMLGNCRDRLSK